MKEKFIGSVTSYISEHLDVELLAMQPDGVHFRFVIEGCFALDGLELHKEQKAIYILTAIFSSLLPGFSFESFLEAVNVPKVRSSLLSHLLSTIYAQNFPIEHLRSKERFTAYLLQQVAAFATDEVIRRQWMRLSFTDKVRVLGFCCKYYEEGSFRLIEVVGRAPFDDICSLIDRGLISRSALFDWAIELTTITDEQFLQFVTSQKAEIEQAIKELHARLELVVGEKLEDSQASQFVNLFGLYDHQVGWYSEEGRELIKGHIEALTQCPQRYKEGMNHLVLALPTYGHSLDSKPWLASIISSLKLLCKTVPSIVLQEHPLFVFDQSEEAGFKKNSRTISELKKRYGVEIIHISKKKLVTFARKLSCEKLLITTLHEHFGFAGARNSIYLLGPLLLHLFKTHGTKGIEWGLLCPEEKFKALFKETVLCNEKGTTILMGEPEVWVPPSTLLSSALFTYIHKNDYFCLSGYSLGRLQPDLPASIDPATILYDNEKILSQFSWSEEPILTTVTNTLCKPKISLNLPFDEKKPDLSAMKNYWVDFRRPSLHLRGWHHPSSDIIPTNHFSGFHQFLRLLNPYIFEMMQIDTLLHPSDKKDSPLVWNRRIMPYNSLQEAIEYIKAEKTEEEMKEQFWKNLARYLSAFSNDPKALGASFALQTLIDLDIEKLFSDFYQKNPAALAYDGDMKSLKRYFLELVNEAKFYKAFAMEVLSLVVKYEPMKAIRLAKEHVERSYTRPIRNMVFARTLYLLCLSVGAGGFQEALRAIKSES